LTHQWWSEQIHPDDRDAVESKLKRAIEAKTDVLLEYRIKYRQNGYIVVHDTAKMLVENGKVARIVGGVRDITERKKAEEALKENQERLEVAQRVAHLGSWEVFVKEDRAVWSKEMFNIFGLEQGSGAPNIADYSKLIHPEDLDALASTMQRLFAVGKLGDTVSFDYRIVMPNHSIRYLHSERMVREVDEEGKAKRIIGIEQDITERKRTEGALRYERSRLQAVVDNLPIGVMIVDSSGKALMLNKVLNSIWQGSRPLEGFEHYEQYLAWDSKTGKKIGQDDWPVSISLKTGQPSGDFELSIERFDGSRGTILTSAVPIKDNEGRIIGGVGIAQDITERKQLQYQLQQYTKNLEELVSERTRQLHDKERLAAIGETAGMVGHDIRNPLQSMIGEIYLLKQFLINMPESQTKKEVDESLQAVDENIAYINKIVADLQDYSRKLTPDYNNINLPESINNIVQGIHVPGNIKLVINAQVPITLKTDPVFIRRALTNLINNAIQAMPSGGFLTIRVYEKGSKALIQVEDTGTGIPEEVKSKLFTPMMTTKAKGQGLGLAVVKRLVEALGGTISFESIAGAGTSFTIELPTQVSRN
jgi:signal transduction histidine kinase